MRTRRDWTIVNLYIGLALHFASASAFAAPPVYSSVKSGPAMFDLSRAFVQVRPDAGTTVQKAAAMLIDEVEVRTGIRWLSGTDAWDGVSPVIMLTDEDQPPARAPDAPESYHLWTSDQSPTPSAVIAAGSDERGVLFAVGRLLRELRMTRGSVTVPNNLDIASSPRYPIRGHQLGYRPKVNTYDGWTPEMYEQYIRDLAVFGANAIELMPPRTDDAADSPHFVMPQIDMLAKISQIAHDYSMDLWLWYPALDADYTDPATIDKALAEWGGVFERLPDVDAVFVPGGDPGHTEPAVMFDLLEKQTAVLKSHHPSAQMWMSPQSFDAEWMETFYALMAQEPAWLSGIVFGPQNRVSLPELRDKIPAKYPIRRYPDITHTIKCQYPVPEWDVAYFLTENREPINPRPMQYADIFRRWDEESVGFITYSEGVNDDVNKAVWSALGWDPDAEVTQILREYGRYFMGPEFENGIAQALLGLERNWQGPLLSNAGVDTTLAQVQAMERDADPWLRHQWRFLQILYRAYYDAYLRTRLLHETDAEARAIDALRRAGEMGPAFAMDSAERTLDDARTARVGEALRARVFELAEGLYQSIRMQLSVPRYQAIAVGRGANLDLIDAPLNNHDWLKAQFAALRAVDERGQREGIDAIVNWTNPGPGGFYDDLGDPRNQRHLVPIVDPSTDPEYRVAPLVGFEQREGWRMSWVRHAESRYDAGLQMHYGQLDPRCAYTLKAIYAGDKRDAKIRCVADGGTVVHDFVTKPNPVAPLTFDVPVEATADGDLTLTWYQEPGSGGNGRGCQIAEVWLMPRK